jgi:hypothetical protein
LIGDIDNIDEDFGLILAILKRSIMEVDIHKVPLREVQDLRELFLRENSFQFVHDKCHGAGWADTYLFSIGKEAVGYGSVWGKDDRKARDTIFEFYLLGPYRKLAPVIFPSFRIASGAPYMECQTNDTGLADMMFANAQNIYADAILLRMPSQRNLLYPILRSERIMRIRSICWSTKE